MKEYQVVEARKSQIEKVMNDMAKDGWEVVSTNYWNSWKISINQYNDYFRPGKIAVK